MPNDVPVDMANAQATTKTGNLKVLAAVAASFTGLGILILALSIGQVITPQLALLMLVALVGLYLGFGVLILLYRFTGRLK